MMTQPQDKKLGLRHFTETWRWLRAAHALLLRFTASPSSHPWSFPLGAKCSTHAHPLWLVHYIRDSSNFLALSRTEPLGSQGLRGHFHRDVLDLVSSQAYFLLVGSNAAFNQWRFNMVPFWVATKVR